VADAGGESMSRVDTAWLRMDTPGNLMMIVGVWILQPGIRHADLSHRIEERLLSYPRFRQKVVQDVSGVFWVMDTAFDLKRHVTLGELPNGVTDPRAALADRVGALAAEPLDPDHPLWHMELVADYDGGSALIARIHHCIADGIALIQVMLSMTDAGAPAPSHRHRQLRGDWLSTAIMGPLVGMSTKAIDMSVQGMARSLGLLREPAQAMDVARMGYQALSDVSAMAMMADDAPTRLKGRVSGRKRVAWCEPLPLADVKAVGRALGLSVNDVLMSCVAGAIGRYLRGHGDDPKGQEIRVMVPVNLRPASQAHQLGNRFGLVPLVLPIGVDNPVHRVFAVRRRMLELKGSFQPLLAFGLLAVAGLLVKPVQHALLNLFARKATAVMTNVPGPGTALQMCGSTLRQVMFWVPQSGDIGLGVSVLSYGGGVQLGLITDEALCPDPQHIAQAFAPEFEQLLLATLMLPWDAGQG